MYIHVPIQMQEWNKLFSTITDTMFHKIRIDLACTIYVRAILSVASSNSLVAASRWSRFLNPSWCTGVGWLKCSKYFSGG